MTSQKSSKTSFLKFAAQTAFQTGKLAGEIGINLLRNHPKTAPHIEKIEDLIDEKRHQVDQLAHDFEHYFWQWIHNLDAESKRVFFPPSNQELRDAFRMLEVSSSASFDEIKKAWKKKMMSYHPDRFANAPYEKQREAEKIAQDINLAYQCLKRYHGQ